MNPFKKFGSWVKSLFVKKVEELPAPPQQETSPFDFDPSLLKALEVLERYAGQLDKEPTSRDYHSGDRPDNKRLALKLAAGDQVGFLRRDIAPSKTIKDEWAALRKNYGTRLFEKLAHTADPTELAKLVAEADEAKLLRARKAAALMAKLDLLPSQFIDNQVKEIMEWSEEALEAMEHRLHTQEKWLSNEPATSAKKRKPAPRKTKQKKAKDVRLAPKRKTQRTKAKRK